MTVLLWKAPVVDDPAAAERLLQPFYDREDDGAFEPSDDVAAVASELLRRFPDADDGPWADGPPAPSDRILLLSIRWSADDAVLDAIQALARERELVLYDPQGPDVHLPSDPTTPEPTRPMRLADHLWLVAVGLAAAAVFWLGWWIDVPVLGWLLMIVGGFFVAVVAFVIRIVTFGPKDDTG
jgi:hypothetical protein